MTLEELLAADSLRAHDYFPSGVPTTYDWRNGPVIHNAKPPADLATPYFNPWGQVYTWSGGTPRSNGRAEIRELQAWLLRKSTLAWEPMYSTNPALDVAAYDEPNDVGDTGSFITKDYTSAPGSVKTYPPGGKVAHFYPQGSRKVVLNPDDVAGVAVTVRMRMTQLGTPPWPEWIGNVGADWWPGATGGGVRGVGQGRFKTLDANQWRVYGFTTAPAVPLTHTSDPEWY